MAPRVIGVIGVNGVNGLTPRPDSRCWDKASPTLYPLGQSELAVVKLALKRAILILTRMRMPKTNEPPFDLEMG